MKLYAIKLPASAKEIADAIGLEAMGEVVEKAGGCKVKVPKNPKPENELVRLVGIDLACKLSDHFGGEELQIPTLRGVANLSRRADVMRLLSEGKITVNEAARRLNLTARQIYTLKNKTSDPRQRSLF